MSVPAIRVRACNDAPVHPGGRYVLYWMIAARRTRWSFGLQRAIEAAVELRRPLVVLEALRSGHRWASDRTHRFVIDGMTDNADRFAGAGVDYVSYVEPAPGSGRGLLEALAKESCLVVTDEFPCFFLPSMVAAAARRLSVRLEAVDSNGLLPIRDAAIAYPSAYAFRRHLQKTLPRHLAAFPEPDPLAADGLVRGPVLDPQIRSLWPSAGSRLASLPIDHGVLPVDGFPGGERAARKRLETFVSSRVSSYLDVRSEPDDDGTSGLSPYLHFGHVSIHETVAALAAREGWTPGDVSPDVSGKREGWWGMSPAAEAFLDQSVTWRELGYNFTARREDYAEFESLPDWARRTLVVHAADPRAHVYELEAFEQARTHDPLWNAAQNQLRREGRIHNTLRMLWGKKILEWSKGPEEALDVMIELNNKFGLDGRNPNSYSGIFWVLGRYDRPWGPERPVYGVIRYMTSENMARKHDVKGYLRRYAPRADGALFGAMPPG